VLRKIAIAVAGVSLMSLLTLAIHGRLVCATVWAQDSPTADDGSSDVAAAQNKASKPTVYKFTGQGEFDATPTTPCSAEKCFSTTGTVTNNALPDLGTGDMVGTVEIDKCKINKAAKSGCCTLTSTETQTFPSFGSLDVAFVGKACGKSLTNVTAKNIHFEITNGTDLFAGATGSGKATFNVNEDTGKGTFSYKGKFSE